MAFTVPDLAYGFEALESHIDTQTMQIHHGKHHAAYVNNLNKATEGKKDFEAKSIEDLVAHINAVPENIRTAVRNNGGWALQPQPFLGNDRPEGWRTTHR